MQNWNIGIIGAGNIADFHAKAIDHIPNASVAGFCDSGSGRAKTLAEKYTAKHFRNYHEMVESGEVNMVTIATPSGIHMEPAIAAAENGVHVLCEKPIEVTLDRIDAMIEAHEKAGTWLGGFFNYRYIDSIAPLKKALKQQRFGHITNASVYVPWWRTDEYYAGNWRGTWKLDGGGALMNQSIHMIDLLQHLMGPVKSLKSYAATLGHDIQTEDTSVTALQFDNGALGMIHGTTASWPGQFRRLEIMGTKGTVVQVEDSISVWQFAEEKPEDKQVLEQFGAVKSGGGVSDPTAIPFEQHQANIEAFMDAIQSKKPFVIDGHEARKAVEIILRIYESAGVK